MSHQEQNYCGYKSIYSLTISETSLYRWNVVPHVHSLIIYVKCNWTGFIYVLLGSGPLNVVAQLGWLGPEMKTETYLEVHTCKQTDI